MLHYSIISFLVLQFEFALSSLPYRISHLSFFGIHKNKNRPLVKSVSLLAPYCPSDHLQAIVRRPILNVLEHQELIYKPPYPMHNARKLAKVR